MKFNITKRKFGDYKETVVASNIENYSNALYEKKMLEKNNKGFIISLRENVTN